MLAGLLDTGSDAGYELGLLAVAGEVEQLGATIALQGREEAAQLEAGVSRHIVVWALVFFVQSRRAHRAAGRWRGRQQRGQSERWRTSS